MPLTPNPAPVGAEKVSHSVRRRLQAVLVRGRRGRAVQPVRERLPLQVRGLLQRGGMELQEGQFRSPASSRTGSWPTLRTSRCRGCRSWVASRSSTPRCASRWCGACAPSSATPRTSGAGPATRSRRSSSTATTSASCLSQLDVLIDGRFEHEQRDLTPRLQGQPQPARARCASVARGGRSDRVGGAQRADTKRLTPTSHCAPCLLQDVRSVNARVSAHTTFFHFPHVPAPDLVVVRIARIGSVAELQGNLHG